MELRTLLHIVKIFAECRLGESRHRLKEAGTRSIIEAAANVLERWPANFHAMLQTLSERNAGGAQGMDIRKQFAPFYTSVFKRSIADREEYVEFIRDAFCEFASNRWGGCRGDSRIRKRVGTQITPSYVSRSELARCMGIDPRTIKRFSLLSPEGLQRGPNGTYLLEGEQPNCTRKSDGGVMRLREAAAELQIPVSVLRALKQSGQYKATHCLPTSPGFHRKDVIAFKTRLLGLAPTNPGSSKAITTAVFGEYMRKGHHSVAEKVGLIVGMLQGEMRVFGNEDGSVKGLLLSQESASQFMTKQRSADRFPVRAN
jgi:hypothetical protein